VQQLTGYESFSRSVLGRWEKKHKLALRAAKEATADGEPAGRTGDVDNSGAFLGKDEKRGRKVEHDFEAEVMAMLVIIAVEDASKTVRKDTDVKKDPSLREEKFVTIVCNAFYSYQTARTAAETVQKRDNWKKNKTVPSPPIFRQMGQEFHRPLRI
jgi:hypothetical protein